MPAANVDLNETVERLWRLVRMHRWWIVGTATVVALATVAVQSFLPNRFRSEATLVVLRQQVNAKYVEPSAMVSPNDAVINLMAEILSRRRLLGIVDEFGLYAKERAHLGPEEVADMMRADIDLDSVEDLGGELTDGERKSLEAARQADRVDFGQYRAVKRSALSRAAGRRHSNRVGIRKYAPDDQSHCA